MAPRIAWRRAAGLLVGLATVGAQDAGIAAKFRAVESGALPQLLQALRNARAAGVLNASVEQTPNLQAGADLTLFTEVAGLAGSGSLAVSAYLQQALGSAGFEPGNVLNALAYAESAGVPAEEIAAARGALDAELERRLLLARSALEASRTPGNLQALAYAIDLASQLRYSDAAELLEATRLFEQQLQGSMNTTEDMELVERAIAVASLANADVPSTLRRWVAAWRIVQGAAQLPKSMGNHATFVEALRRAKDVDLPRFDEMDTLEGAVAMCTQMHLNESLSKSDDETDLQYAERLMREVDAAREAQLSGALVASLMAAAQATAEQLLGEVANMTPAEALSIRSILQVAEGLGLPASDIQAAEAVVHGTVQASVSEAMSAVAGARRLAGGDGAGGSVNIGALKDLALAIHFAVDLGYDQTELQAARRLYTSFFQGPFEASDVDLVVEAANYADHAEIPVPHGIGGWRSLVPLIRQLEASSREDPSAMREYLAVLIRAKGSKLPVISELEQLKAKAQRIALASVTASMASAADLNDPLPDDFNDLLAALMQAREAEVPADQLEAAESFMQDIGSTALAEAVNASTLDVRGFRRAVELAELAGVGAEDIEAAREELQATARSELQAAASALEGAGTAENVKALAMAIYRGRGFGLDVEPPAAGRLIEDLVAKPIGAGDLPILEMAVQMADHAGIHIETKLTRTAQLARKVRESLARSSETTERLLDLLGQASDLDFPATDDLAAVRERAREQAQAELERAVSDQGAVIQDALDAAVSAGVPQSALDRAQTVLSAQAPIK